MLEATKVFIKRNGWIVTVAIITIDTYTNRLDDTRDGIYWKKVTYIKSLIVEFKQRAENNTERDGKIDVDKDGIVEDIEK